MQTDLILVPTSEGAGSSAKRRNYHITRASVVIGTITLMMQEQSYEWSLPAWIDGLDEVMWEDLHEALAMRQRIEGLDVARAWLPTPQLSGEKHLGLSVDMPFSWLHATTHRATAPSYFTGRYPAASDAVALAQLAQDSQALTVVGAHSTLSATFDATFAVFAKRWGIVLEACSIVVEGRRSITGAALTTLYGETPLIALLATASPLIARDLLVMVLDALADLRYPTVNVLLHPISPYVPSAVSLGFEPIGQVQQAFVYSYVAGE